jgi:dCMP deaminase
MQKNSYIQDSDIELYHKIKDELIVTKKAVEQAKKQLDKHINWVGNLETNYNNSENTPNKWHKRFLELAKLVSTWSKDPSTQVGSVIVNDKNRIVSLGFNGYPRGVKDEGLDNREVKYLKILHGEINSILFSKQDLTDCTIYVYPLPPCANCTSVIIQSGISKIVVLENQNKTKMLERWSQHNLIAKEMAEEAEVEIIKYFEGN